MASNGSARSGAARVAGIDALRGLCAAMVFAFHAMFLSVFNGEGHWAMPPGAAIAAYGFLGVPVFFMISGYVISMSAEGRSRREFVASRAARLAPAYYLALIAAALALIAGGGALSLRQIAGNLILFAKGVGADYIDPVYWSLVVEVIFYAVVFVFVIGRHFRARLRAFAWLWLAVAALHYAVGLPKAGVHNGDWAPFFAVGIAAFLHRQEGRRLDAALLAVAAMLSAWSAYRLGLAAAPSPFAARPIGSALVVLVLGALFVAATRHPLPARFDRIAVRAGALSYPVYLLHNVFGNAVMNALHQVSAWLVPVGVVIVLLASQAVVVAERHLAPRLKAAILAAPLPGRRVRAAAG